MTMHCRPKKSAKARVTRTKRIVGWVWTDNNQSFETCAKLTDAEAVQLRTALDRLSADGNIEIDDVFVCDPSPFVHPNFEALVKEIKASFNTYDETGNEESPSFLMAALADAKAEG